MEGKQRRFPEKVACFIQDGSARGRYATRDQQGGFVDRQADWNEPD
jgi:hypothetical protein